MSMKVPAEYYSSLDDLKVRRDKFSRPELCKGVYDILVPKEYK